MTRVKKREDFIFFCLLYPLYEFYMIYLKNICIDECFYDFLIECTVQVFTILILLKEILPFSIMLKNSVGINHAEELNWYQWYINSNCFASKTTWNVMQKIPASLKAKEFLKDLFYLY